MGLTFKENCSDIRNTKIIDIIKYFKKKKCRINVYDPLVKNKVLLKKYNINLLEKLKNNYYDVVVITVAHNIFKKIGLNKLICFNISGNLSKL